MVLAMNFKPMALSSFSWTTMSIRSIDSNINTVPIYQLITGMVLIHELWKGQVRVRQRISNSNVPSSNTSSSNIQHFRRNKTRKKTIFYQLEIQTLSTPLTHCSQKQNHPLTTLWTSSTLLF